MTITTTSSAPTVTTSIPCEKCKAGTMQRDRVPRMSPALRFIGFTLWIPALALVLLTTACGVLFAGAGASATAGTLDAAKKNAIAQLHQYDAPFGIVDEFDRTGTVQDASLEALHDEATRAHVKAILQLYHATIAGGAIGATAATGIAGALIVGAYVVGIPLFIVGLLLTLKKNVWRCATCGYVFDRA